MILESSDGGRVLALAQRELDGQLESARRGAVMAMAGARGAHTGTSASTRAAPCALFPVGKRALSGGFGSVEARGEFRPGG